MASRFTTWLADTRAWLGEHPARAAVVAGALAAGGVAGVPVEEKAFDYVWRDPSFCDDCHVHDYANRAYDASVHAGLTTCHDCHLVPISHYPRNLWGALFARPQGPEDIHRPEVASVICTQCHSAETDDAPLTGPMPDAVRARVVKVDASPLHRVHLESKERRPSTSRGGSEPPARADAGTLVAPFDAPSWDAGAIGCIDCHGSDPNRAHQFTATRDNCLACHGDLQVHTGRLADLDCRQCHLSGFVAPATHP